MDLPRAPGVRKPAIALVLGVEFHLLLMHLLGALKGTELFASSSLSSNNEGLQKLLSLSLF